MTLFPLNVVLALAWAALMTSFSFVTLVTGYLIGFAALWMAQPLYNRPSPYFLRSVRVVRLILFFVYELVVSSLQVAWDVLTPADRSTPAIVAMPLDARSDTEILLVTNLISLTPGTLSLDISPDRRTLYVHAMFGADPERLVQDLKNGMERMVLEVFAE